MITFVLIVLAGAVAALRIGRGAAGLMAVVSVVAGIALLMDGPGRDPVRALSGAGLMATGSVTLASLYFTGRIRLAFVVVMVMPFLFVAGTAWPLLESPRTHDQAWDLILLATATAVTLAALGVGPPRNRNARAGNSGDSTA